MTLDEIIKADVDLCGAIQADDIDKYIEVLTAKREELIAPIAKQSQEELTVLAKAQLAFTQEAIAAGKIATIEGLYQFMGFGPPPKRLIDAALEKA